MSFVTTIKQQFEANENVGYGKKQSDYLKNNFVAILLCPLKKLVQFYHNKNFCRNNFCCEL